MERILRNCVGNIGAHLLLNQGPTILAVAMHMTSLPMPALMASDLFNVATGLPALVCDAREIPGTLKNPLATRTDRVMDVAHGVTDVLSTIGAIVPLVTSLNNPIATGLFLGLQGISLAFDIAKTIYDHRRGGQQSDYEGGRAAVAEMVARGTNPIMAGIHAEGLLALQ